MTIWPFGDRLTVWTSLDPLDREAVHLPTSAHHSLAKFMSDISRNMFLKPVIQWFWHHTHTQYRFLCQCASPKNFIIFPSFPICSTIFSHHFPHLQPSFHIFSHMFHCSTGRSFQAQGTPSVHVVQRSFCPLQYTSCHCQRLMAGKSPKMELFCWENPWKMWDWSEFSQQSYPWCWWKWRMFSMEFSSRVFWWHWRVVVVKA